MPESGKGRPSNAVCLFEEVHSESEFFGKTNREGTARIENVEYSDS